jgi:aspartate aminotransferase-like enzyme
MPEQPPSGPPARLFTPGPTELPDSVYRALARRLVPARSAAFQALMTRIGQRLREVFLTAGDVITLTASGTGAMEAAFVNLVPRAGPVLVVHAGLFGERWEALAAAYGVPHAVLARPWGQTVRPAELAAALAANPQASTVLLTHSETSTGVVHDVRALAQTVRDESDALVVVDAVSSAGAVALHMDAWGVDACVAAAHKGFLCPPGLSFVALGARALDRVRRADLPRLYFDLALALAGLEQGGTPWTPAVSLAYALDAGLEQVLGQGLEATWARTRRLAEATRAGVRAAGLSLFADPPGDTVTAVLAPPGLDARELVSGLRQRGMLVATGQGDIKRRVFRIAHLGAIQDADLVALMRALEDTLASLDAPPLIPGEATAATARVLAAG